MTSSKVPKQIRVIRSAVGRLGNGVGIMFCPEHGMEVPQSMNHVLGGSDDPVGDLGEAVTDGPVGDEAQGRLVVGLVERGPIERVVVVARTRGNQVCLLVPIQPGHPWAWRLAFDNGTCVVTRRRAILAHVEQSPSGRDLSTLLLGEVPDRSPCWV